MEKVIRERYNEAILQEAAARYGIKTDQIRLLDGFESFMYEFDQNGQAFILRLSHSFRRSVSLIRGEVDWINYLADGGLGVSRIVPSPGGELVEIVDDNQGGQFLATAFVKAAGGPPWESGQWDERLFECYGRFLGQMHALSKAYELPNPAWKRPEWDDPELMDVFTWLPESQQLVREKAEAVMRQLRALPKDEASYGLIHQDAHGGNFFVDEQYRITLFDFDDCVYSWYVYDIAMVLFYALTNHDDPQGFGAHFWSHFWPGYRAENYLDPIWLEQMQAFFKLREIDLYAIIHRSFDVDNLSDPWVKAFMDGRRERIERDLPYVSLEFPADLG